MKRLAHFNIGILIALAASLYIAYYLLLKDNFLHISISDIINNAHQFKSQKHMLVLGFLPIYIGTIVFGFAMLGVYIGSRTQRLILKKHTQHAFNLKNNVENMTIFTISD